MNRHLLRLLVVALLTLGVITDACVGEGHAAIDTTIASPPAPAAPTVLCQPHQVHHAQFGGVNYLTQNSVWGKAGQCITIKPGARPGFTVTTASSCRSHAQEVNAYPDILDGNFYGLHTYHSKYPVQVSKIKSLTVSWYTADKACGAWNTSIDSYLSPTPAFMNSAGDNTAKAEVMVWLRCQGIGTGTIETVTIAGIRWDLNFWDQHPPVAVPRIYLQFRSVVPRSTLKRYQLLAIYQWLAARKFIKSSWYLQGLMAGFERVRGGKGLSTHWFRDFLVTR